MKRLIALLLLAPLVANATNYPCPPNPVCTLPPLTSGTLTLTDEVFLGDSGGTASWTASGPGYTTGGYSAEVEKMGLIWPIPYGEGAGFYVGQSTDDFLSESLTVNAVSWFTQPQVNGAGAFISATSGPITHAGTYLASFDFQSIFDGWPAGGGGNGESCAVPTPCYTWRFDGGGTGVLYVSNYPGQPNTFYVTGGTFTFRAPEPSTASLLLLGLAGLAAIRATFSRSSRTRAITPSQSPGVA